MWTCRVKNIHMGILAIHMFKSNDCKRNMYVDIVGQQWLCQTYVLGVKVLRV